MKKNLIHLSKSLFFYYLEKIPLHEAAKSGSLDIVQYCHHEGIPLQVQDRNCMFIIYLNLMSLKFKMIMSITKCPEIIQWPPFNIFQDGVR